MKKMMQMRRYCVTVKDNWTPVKFFWTDGGARRWIRTIPAAGIHVRLYQWKNGKWLERDWTSH